MDHTFAATIHIVPETSSARVQLAGDVDLAAEPRLREILAILVAAEARDVYVDLGGVAFADTSLINFLVQAAAAGPVVLCRVGPNVERLIEIAGLQAIVLVRDEGPANPRRLMPTARRPRSARFAVAGRAGDRRCL